MVKNIIFLVFIAIIVGCSHHNNLVLIKYDDGVKFINYCDTIIINQQIKEVSSNIQMNEFVVKNTTRALGKQIIGADSAYFIDFITNFTNSYYKNIMESDYEKDYQSVDFDSNVYVLGKITIKNGVDSYLLLFEQKDLFYETSNTTSKNYYLFNYKNNLLKSVVNLSTSINGIDDGILINSYLINNLYFSQINFSFSITDINTILPEKLYNKYISKENKLEFLYYSLFQIDENGFIKFINI